MTHVTCRLTAKNRDQRRNPTLGNRVWATFTFLLFIWCQFEKRELDVQPFGVTVCEETDRVVVACCTPMFRSSNKLIIFNAANFAHVHTVALADSYDVPRCAIAVGRNFAVCHGCQPIKQGNGKVSVCRNRVK